ncbi:putative aldehyde dehydrogenase [Gordonia polyisoprenivorans NBRC 16320 = JCM 10675]|uniref:Aldehyde dehydrogenase n=1 Tax=Gordonia polyisoprenivorans TaxID=84595 RepID=A0A846WS48_9ACTN|nr:aldehyde dehydrogenase [Gordonia polyisoprenivorans]NKY04424.1 aldehyde dehydrogenase [Gordonia polyisoprenivorans]OZC29460.1 aldehyde dehydrogenase [Gordonia polyisoprenivorans]WCB38926.1 aldehyde dehydrogenase [Gordonia polyisoprenivorans]GAB25448.1 putative aldehyde dehydrogenase [Gordonia polyisoprenivorans NBRC 16320 = JCM 10675]
MTTIDYPELYIGGGWSRPATSDRIQVTSPTTEEVIGSVPAGSTQDVDRAVAAARAAFDDPQGWSTWEPKQRAEVLERFASELEARAGELSRRVSMQNGMPIWLAEQFEGGFPPVLLRYFSDLMVNAPDVDSRPGMLGGTALVRRRPIGVVGAIVPWNVPQAISFLKLAPALAAGCTVVIKPAEETVLDAFLTAEAAAAAGLPDGVLNIVPGGRDTGAYLVEHPDIDKVSFTGSTAAGRKIAETCGRLLRPVTLELGGKSAAILLDDVDLSASMESLFGATLLNNGQICWLNTRVLAPTSRYDEVVDALTGLASSLTVGDPLDPETKIGPLVSSRQRDRVEGYIAKGKAEGGRMTTGGKRPSSVDAGWFVEPTIFADVDNNATISREEIFGPVLSVIPFRDEAEALAIANDSEYGLGGTVWSADVDHAADIAAKVKSGTVGVNHYSNEPVAPFGGIKNSGMGRELGPEGLHAFQHLHTVYLPPAG